MIGMLTALTLTQLKVIRYIRPIYACRACEMVTQAPAQSAHLQGGPGPNLIAHIAAKYYDGLPLYRQSKIFEHEGVDGMARPSDQGYSAAKSTKRGGPSSRP